MGVYQCLCTLEGTDQANCCLSVPKATYVYASIFNFCSATYCFAKDVEVLDFYLSWTSTIANKYLSEGIELS